MNKYDYILFCDDEAFFIIPNLKYYLTKDEKILKKEKLKKPIFLGDRHEAIKIDDKHIDFEYNGGNAFLLNKAALDIWYEYCSKFKSEEVTHLLL